MSSIDTIHAREILDSRGNPTVEVEVSLAGIISASKHSKKCSAYSYFSVRYRHRTPAMAAGLTDRRWTVRELLSMPLL